MAEPMCNIPVSAVVVVENGKATVQSAEYEQIPAALIAQFFLERVGAETIFGSEQESK